MVFVLQLHISLTKIIRAYVFYGCWFILLYGISYGLHGYIIQDDSRRLQGMIHVTGYIGVPIIYYKEATDGLFGSFGNTFVPHTRFHIQLLEYIGGWFIIIAGIPF